VPERARRAIHHKVGGCRIGRREACRQGGGKSKNFRALL